ncbi:MAG: hypothetical protein PUG16_00645 [Lachnospiraceae bacterium]|jgi:hypothetical protein|nr:hypothetical protein [Lachnospiraceae bacterium]
MAVNPGSIFKIMQLKKRFEDNHPKMAAFLQNVLLSGLPEGTVIDIRVEKPGENPIEANMRVTADDIEMAQELKSMQ